MVRFKANYPFNGIPYLSVPRN